MTRRGAVCVHVLARDNGKSGFMRYAGKRDARLIERRDIAGEFYGGTDRVGY